MLPPNAVSVASTLEQAHERMARATAQQLLSVLTAMEMGHVLPVFAQSPVVISARRGAGAGI